ncbi:hypothetical protein Q9251_17135 [Alkalihalobacillus macyae]|uniref:glucosamine inositolphosphorylceramide transferase family protein n=1 Tax=Guptibacillus hwajinpoensis TaxID=208199 RepID=UPI00273ACDF5|nr:hypothetical protein [Alkalihalobacillus macyae]MDP4552605.1 hypothetical protein [Alkalihalobacillus macyae]
MLNRKRFKYGIIVDSLSISKWQMMCIDNLCKKQAELTLVLVENSVKKTELTRSNVLFHVTELCFASSLTRKTSLKQLLNTQSNCDVRLVQSEGEEGAFIYSSEDLRFIDKHNLDFIIRFTNTNLLGGILTLPRFGVWTYQFGDISKYHGALKGFWEVYNNDAVTNVSLLKLGYPAQTVVVLKKGVFSTITTSYFKNRNQILSEVIDWAAQVCISIKANTFSTTSEIIRGKSIEKRIPTNKEYLLYTANIFKNHAIKLFDRLFRYEYWNVGISNKPIESFINQSEADINWLFEKKDLYYADPFAYQDGEECYLMVEELDERVVSGYLTRFTLNCGELSSVEKSILKIPSHMSYPFILEEGGETYCIPETSEEREVAIYKLDKQTGDWRKVKVLLQGFPAIDSTIIKHDGKWWLFCTNADHGALRDLYIFYSDDLFGSWAPHLLNPVKQDVRSSRPAGTIFEKDDVLYRPAQDCSLTYGGRIGLNRINVLTTTDYDEEVYTYINPKSGSLYSDGTHTISSVGNVTLFDGKRVDYSFSNVVKKIFMIRHKLKRCYSDVLCKLSLKNHVQAHKKVS